MFLSEKTADKNAQNQWLWWLGGVLLALGAMIAVDFYLERLRTLESEKERLRTQTRVLAENIEHQLHSTSLVLESVRDELAPWKNPSARISSMRLKAFVNAMPGIRFIGVLDSKGVLRASNLTEYIGRDFSYRDYFEVTRRQGDARIMHVSPPFKSAAGISVINVSRMIPGPRGEFAGVVTASLDPEYFKTLMSSVLYAPDMWDALAHGDGTLFLMVPGRDDLHGMNLAKSGSFFSRHRDSGQMVTVMSGSVYSTGDERVMVQHSIRPPKLGMDQPLVVAVSRDLPAVFESWRRVVLVQAALFGVFAVASIMALFTYLRHRRRMQQLTDEARAQAVRFEVALDHIPAYIFMKDVHRRYIYANKATLELFHCTESELVGSDDARFFPPETVAQICDIDTQVLEYGEDTATEVVVPDGGGKRKIYWEVKTPLYEDAAKTRICGLCGISTDITEREELKEVLQRQANLDFLTGLSNRRNFMAQGMIEFVRAQRYGNPLALIMIDIDHFKKINDTYGHQVGDLVLQRLSETMRQCLRSIDIIGRIGGEEFAILLPETGLELAVEAAERLRAQISECRVVLKEGLPVHFTISIGVAEMKDKETNLDMLLNQADAALYRAKEGGRNQVCVT